MANPSPCLGIGRRRGSAPSASGCCSSSSSRLRQPRGPRRPEMERKGMSYVTAAELVFVVRDPKIAIIDVRLCSYSRITRRGKLWPCSSNPCCALGTHFRLCWKHGTYCDQCLEDRGAVRHGRRIGRRKTGQEDRARSVVV